MVFFFSFLAEIYFTWNRCLFFWKPVVHHIPPFIPRQRRVCLLFVGCHVYFRHANHHHHQRHVILVLVLIVNNFLFLTPSFLSFFLFSFLPFHHRLLDTMAEQPSSLQKVRTSAAGSWLGTEPNRHPSFLHFPYLPNAVTPPFSSL